LPQIECTAILFDLDGVLIDSTENITRHWREWAEQHNLDVDAIMQVAHGRRTIETMRIVAPHLPVEEEAQRFTASEVVDTQGIITIDGALPLLNSIPADAWAIVTSGARDLATARLRSRGLPVPQVMVTADDVINGKPHPEPYITAANLLGLSADQCVVIEDAPAGLAAAAAAGMRTVAVASTHAYHELGTATLIAGQLRDIQVVAGHSARLAIQIVQL
jgi:mannitol-1-/sugar-/sorbitol-6-phosphatase